MTTNLAGMRVTVMGLGRFGGGAGVTRFLASQGARVLVTDMSPESKLSDSIDEIADLLRAGSVTLRLGGHDERDFTHTDLVVVNPAVPKPWDNPLLKAAKAAGVTLTTEMKLLIERLPDRARTVGMTGSAGKSTTTAMIHAAIRSAAPCVMGGNIGSSLLPVLGTITPKTVVVLELSSAMLYWLGELGGFSPATAVWTNLAPNHADWHGDHTHYGHSKAQILLHQLRTDTAIMGAGPSSGVDAFHALTKAKLIKIERDTFPLPLSIPGAHNRLNASMALEAACAALPGTQRESLASVIASFTGLPHRLQLVCTKLGVRYYNDSKCTTVDALMQALGALSPHGDGLSKIHLIAGGYDKKVSLREVSALATKLAGLYTLGVTGPTIARDARALGATNVHEGATLRDVFTLAKQHAKPGDTVLLSPACASWDQYPNYEHRGEEFCTLAESIA